MEARMRTVSQIAGPCVRDLLVCTPPWFACTLQLARVDTYPSHV